MTLQAEAAARSRDEIEGRHSKALETVLGLEQRLKVPPASS